MLDILIEFSKVSRTIRVDFFPVFITNSIVEVSDKFGSLMCQVAPIPCDRTIEEFACVLITIVKVHHTLACHHTFFKITFVNPTMIMQNSLTMEKSISELTSIF